MLLEKFSPPKTEFPVKSVINLSIQISFSFLSHLCCLQDWEVSKKKKKSKWLKWAASFQLQKPLPVLCFLFVEKDFGHQSFPEFQRADLNSLGKQENAESKEK